MSLATWAEDLADLLDADADTADVELGRQGENPYVADPVGWARDKAGLDLWSKQRDIANSVVANRRTAVKSGHGIGKTLTAAVLAAWWNDVHPIGESIVVSTAPSHKQVHIALWAEIAKIHHAAGLPGTILQNDEWKAADGTVVAMGRKPADHDEQGFQGIHRRYVLVILDEAGGIPKSLWTGAEAITTNADARILAIGNPDDPNTDFGKVCKPGSGWSVLGMSVLDSPNFTGEQVPAGLAPMLPTPEWVEHARVSQGEESPWFVSRVLGEFPELGSDSLISPRLIAAAQERELDPTGLQALGVDVARFGSDRTVVGHRQGPVYRRVGSYARQATTETTGRVIAHSRDLDGDFEIRVDGVGVGGGVVDQLAEAGWPVVDMQAGSAAADPERFANARAEWFWGLRERFEQGDIDLDPDDDDLAAQLGAIKFKYTSRGQVQIESKDDMRKRGMPSPDDADTLMLAMAWVPPDAGRVVTAEDFDEGLAEYRISSY